MKKLLYIRWQDHHNFSSAEWRDFEDFDEIKSFTVDSVGWLMNETKTHVALAAHCSFDTEQATGEMMILKKTIIERREIPIE